MLHECSAKSQVNLYLVPDRALIESGALPYSDRDRLGPATPRPTCHGGSRSEPAEAIGHRSIIATTASNEDIPGICPASSLGLCAATGVCR